MYWRTELTNTLLYTCIHNSFRLFEDLGLPKKRKSMVDCLSGGMQRKLSVAIAFVGGSQTVILDEPTAGVDVEQRKDLWAYLKEMNERGKTIILTSHYLEEIEYLCNDIAIINHGKIVANGTKESFMKGGKSVEEAYLEITRNDDKKS